MSVSVVNPALGAIQRILVYDIEVDGVPLNLSSSEIKQIDITNNENKHEAVKITTQLTKKQIAEFVNKPISFTYGRRSRNNKFYGYVVAINPNREYQQDTVVDIFCLGPTWPLQSGIPRFVRNTTAPGLFADIVVSHNLGAQVDTHSYTWPVLAQSDESDWEFLLTLAHRIGYAIYNYRGTVRLVQPLRVLTETPIYQSYLKGDDVLDPTRELLEWTATSQSLQLRENVKPSFGFFEGDLAATTQPLSKRPYRLRTDTPISDRKMATTYSSAWSNRIDFWNEQAEARINGNAQIVPGVTVSIKVSGQRAQVNEYDGTWLVRGVRHTLTHNSFQTLLDLARSTNTRPTNRNSRWFWNVDQGSPRVLKDEQRGTWKSSWTKVETVECRDFLFEEVIVPLDSPLSPGPLLDSTLPGFPVNEVFLPGSTVS